MKEVIGSIRGHAPSSDSSSLTLLRCHGAANTSASYDFSLSFSAESFDWIAHVVTPVPMSSSGEI